MEENSKENWITGTCKFCGQTVLVPPTVDQDQDKADEEASRRCACSEAKSYARQLERRKTIDKYLTDHVHPSCQTAVEEAIKCVENYDWEKVTIKDREGWTTQIYMDKDAYLNIKRKATKTGEGLRA